MFDLSKIDWSILDLSTLDLASVPETQWKALLALAVAAIAWRGLRRASAKTSNTLANVHGPGGASFLQGHYSLLFNNDAWSYHRSLAQQHGRAFRVKGTFGQDVLYTYDPKAMHHILLKDQHMYEEPEVFSSNATVTFGPGVLSVVGDRHRKQRKMLNPVFSVTHLRHMVPTFFGVAKQLGDTFMKKASKGPQEIDMVTWMTRAALEIVAQSGLGTSFSPVTEEHPEHSFITAVKELGPLMTVLLLPRLLVVPPVFKYNLGGAWLQRLVVNLVPWKAVHQMRDVIDTMHQTSLDIFEQKRNALAQDDSDVEQRQDIMSILMRENKKASLEDRLSDAEVLGQMSIHQDVQSKLRAELREAYENFGDEPDHDQLVGLPYLDAVCRETLRLFPPVATILRETQVDAMLPFSTPVKGSKNEEMSEVLIPRGSAILISILASNTDPEIWGSDSYEWKPERWLSPHPKAVTDAHIPGVYSNLMTFSGGGRSCIGFKFSQLEMKVILYTLIRQLQFSLPEQKIYWQMTVISSPTIDPTLSDLRPQMPLLVSLAEES
ncbi:hypothetical protein H1R20_g5421, partial [Candolleomyces eurysporus]